LRLYYSPGACSLAVHVVLEEIGLDYEIECVNVLEGDNLREPYLSINPRGRVPALADGDALLRETVALLVHLALSHPQARLLPPVGSHDFAHCLEWLSWIGSTPHIRLFQFWRPHRVAPPEAPLDAISEMARQDFKSDCGEIEQALVGPWFFGDHFTVVDPYLLFCYRQGNRIGLPMADLFPRFTDWAHRMVARPSVAKVWEREGISLGGDADRLTPQRTVTPL
jgi:glutathione S-transferase